MLSCALDNVYRYTHIGKPVHSRHVSNRERLMYTTVVVAKPVARAVQPSFLARYVDRQPLPADPPFRHFLVALFAMLRLCVVNPPVHVVCSYDFSTDNSLRFSSFTSSCLGYGHGCLLGPRADLTDSNWAPVLAVLRFCGGGKAWLQQTDFGSVLRRQGDQLCERWGWSWLHSIFAGYSQ